jgi:hypothetical protein
MKDGYRTLYDDIHGSIVHHSVVPREIFAAAGLVLADVYLGILRDAPDDKLRCHMLRQTLRALIDAVDEWEERHEQRQGRQETAPQNANQDARPGTDPLAAPVGRAERSS